MCDARAISDALGGKRYGDSYRMACPAHSGTNPTALVVADKDGKTLVHCFSGCTQEEVISALTDLGLWQTNSGRFENHRRREEISHARLVVRMAESDIKKGKVLSADDLKHVDHALDTLREVQT